jgi:3-deoxy-D-manno-octulosonic-acid transferase
VRFARNRTYRPHFAERLGFLPRPFTRTKPGCIWLHAVSVGEVASAIPLLREWKTKQPAIPIFLSTSTVAGRKGALRQAAGLADGVFYCPFDFVSCVRRVLRTIRPALLVVLETEIWPNLYAETKRGGAQLAIVNGRISNRTWPRYRFGRAFFRRVLQVPDLVLVQSREDELRYEELGVDRDKLSVAGNLKYDASVPGTPVSIPTFGAGHVWVAASTVGPNERGSLRRHAIDEDEIVIRAFLALADEFPKLLLILAPRQPARFDEVAGKLEQARIRFLRRSFMSKAPEPSLQLPGVLLLDTIGELAGVYRTADVVFVGGSIAPRGGHNIIEPAAAGAPVVIGPNMQNFEAIARDFLEAGAIVQISNGEQLLPAVRGLLCKRERAAELGMRARHLVDGQRGAAQSIATRLLHLYFAATLRPLRNLFSELILRSISWIWREGAAFNRRRSERVPESQLPLPVSVISIGGITIGGSGKTPFTSFLAERLKTRGYSPGILTRGYRRRSPDRNLVFSPGVHVSAAITGDEAQIFLRSGIAPIGIGANRFITAHLLLEQIPSTDVLLLDDGFQHARLRRDFDILVIDGLDPFGQDEVVPLGRLREPLDALGRADMFVVTRAETDLRYRAICARLGAFNRQAAVFRTRIIARCWRDYRTGACRTDLDDQPVAAFCGLGNPASFWRTLESLGLNTVFRWSFPDHHTYKPFELQRVAAQARMHGAKVLVTTEKDRINCPDHLERAIAPLDLAWLEIDLKLEEEAAFFALLEKGLRTRQAARAGR